MHLLASVGARERSRTLVAQPSGIWLWPGVLLSLRRGGEITPVSDEILGFWLTRLHGPEVLNKGLSWKASRTARLLARGKIAEAQDVIDSLGLFALSQDGAALMKAMAREFGLDVLNLPVLDSSRTWDARDIAHHLTFFKEAIIASRPLAKGTFPVFDPAKHPRWPAGTPQGGQFAPGDGAGTALPQLIAGDEPRKPEGVVGIPSKEPDPLDPQGLNVLPPTPEEQKSIADTLTVIDRGSDEELAALHPHPYQNRPHQTTGAVLPPSLEGYVAFDVASGSVHRGSSRLIIDSGTGAMYYTNKHYYSFYVVRPTGSK